MDFFVEKQNILGGYCTVVDGANIAPGREVDEDTSAIALPADPRIVSHPHIYFRFTHKILAS